MRQKDNLNICKLVVKRKNDIEIQKESMPLFGVILLKYLGQGDIGISVKKFRNMY